MYPDFDSRGVLLHIAQAGIVGRFSIRLYSGKDVTYAVYSGSVMSSSASYRGNLSIGGAYGFKHPVNRWRGVGFISSIISRIRFFCFFSRGFIVDTGENPCLLSLLPNGVSSIARNLNRSQSMKTTRSPASYQSTPLLTSSCRISLTLFDAMPVSRSISLSAGENPLAWLQ